MANDDYPTSTTCPSCNEATSISPADQTCDSCGADINKIQRERASEVRNALEAIRAAAEDFPHGTLKASRKQSDVVRLRVEYDGPVRLQNPADLPGDELNATAARVQHVDELAMEIEDDIDAVSQFEIWTRFDNESMGSIFGMTPSTENLPETDVIYLFSVHTSS